MLAFVVFKSKTSLPLPHPVMSLLKLNYYKFTLTSSSLSSNLHSPNTTRPNTKTPKRNPLLLTFHHHWRFLPQKRYESLSHHHHVSYYSLQQQINSQLHRVSLRDLPRRPQQVLIPGSQSGRCVRIVGPPVTQVAVYHSHDVLE